MNSENYHHGATEITYYRASRLRKPLTKAEKILWPCLRNRNLEGYKIRRQHPVGPFIADFYCHEARLIIEIDGENHLMERVRRYDKRREEKLRSFGLEILRITNDEVFQDVDEVLKLIVVTIRNRMGVAPQH